MASVALAKPGTEFGPCVDLACGHSDCESSRNTAKEVCHLCNDVIGYDRLYYQNEFGDCEHATCAERLINAERTARDHGFVIENQTDRDDRIICFEVYNDAGASYPLLRSYDSLHDLEIGIGEIVDC